MSRIRIALLFLITALFATASSLSFSKDFIDNHSKAHAFRAPDSLAFDIHPSNTVVGDVIGAFTVRVLDENGDLDTAATNMITIDFATNPGGGSLSGTTTVAAVNGIATFNTLQIDQFGEWI